MLESCTGLIQKYPTKSNAVGNYRPIACTLLSGIITDKLYEYLENQELLPQEQNGCRQRLRGAKNQLLKEKAVIKNFKSRKTNIYLKMAHSLYPIHGEDPGQDYSN